MAGGFVQGSGLRAQSASQGQGAESRGQESLQLAQSFKQDDIQSPPFGGFRVGGGVLLVQVSLTSHSACSLQPFSLGPSTQNQVYASFYTIR